MNKNRMKRPTAADERQNTAKSQIHQGCWWQIRRLCAEGGRTYLGRSAACHGIVTEGEGIHSDRAVEVSSGHSSPGKRDEGPNGRERQVVGGTR